MDRYIIDITNAIIALTGLIVALAALKHGKSANTAATETQSNLDEVVKTNNLNGGK